MRSKLGEFLAASLLLAFAAYVLFHNLGAVTLSDFDEARHAQNALEMLRSGDWVATQYGGKPDLWNLKPPLGAWLMALSFWVLGPSALSVRIVSALAGLGTVLLVYAFGRQLRNGWVGLSAAVILLANPSFVGWHGCRTGDHDALLTFWVVLAMALVHRIGLRRRTRLLYFVAAALGLAVLTKGVVGLLPILAAGPWLLVRLGAPRGRAEICHALLSLALFVALVSPWVVLRALRNDGFFETMFSYDVWKRFSEPIEGHVGGPLFYAMRLQRDLGGPMFAGFVLSVLIAAGSAARRRSAGLLVVWIAAFLLPFTLAASKISWYLLPAAPAVSLLLADSFEVLRTACRIPGWLAFAAWLALLARPLSGAMASAAWTSAGPYELAIQQLSRRIQRLDAVLIHTSEATQATYFYLSVHARKVTVFPSFFALRPDRFERGVGLLTRNPDFQARLRRSPKLVVAGSFDGVSLFARRPASRIRTSASRNRTRAAAAPGP